MAARWVAAAILLVMVAIIGIFLWAIIRPPAPPVEGAAGTPAALAKHIAGPAPWTQFDLGSSDQLMYPDRSS